jgi:egghead protein (zeste-white 4 protein)
MMEAGVRARWCDGYLEEQSTQSTRDFIRQRRRWYQGLVKVSLYAPVRLRWRFCLAVNTFLWTLAPFAVLYTVAHSFYGFAEPFWVRMCANLSFASFVTLYLVGLKANMDENSVIGLSRAERAMWTVAQILLLPVFSAIEAVGVLSALVKPATGFHVVKK